MSAKFGWISSVEQASSLFFLPAFCAEQAHAALKAPILGVFGAKFFLHDVTQWVIRWRAELLRRRPHGLWSYLTIYVLRASHGRYLLPALPLLAIFFIEFMRHVCRMPVLSGWVVFLTAGLVFLGMCFESQYVWIKVVLNSAVLAAMAASVILGKRRPKAQEVFAWCVPALIGMSTAAAALAASLLLPGQIGIFFCDGI